MRLRPRNPQPRDLTGTLTLMSIPAKVKNKPYLNRTRGTDYAHQGTTRPPRIFRPCDGPEVDLISLFFNIRIGLIQTYISISCTKCHLIDFYQVK